MNSRKGAALGLLAWLSLSGCQLAFGDFTIDTTRLAVSCQSNATRCQGNQIQTCINGSEWKTLAVCSAPDLCNLSTLTCAPCEPGSYQCNGADPQVCGQDQKWSSALSAPCASAALCVAPDDGSPAHCLAAGCPVAGQLQCASDHLQVCPATQTGWEDVEICASPALCEVSHASLQVQSGMFATCVLPTCSPGQFNCDLGSPRPCRSDRAGWDAPLMTCMSGSCNVDKGDCSACTPGSYACSGAALSRCDEQQRWTHVSCASVLSCNDGLLPGCDPQICRPGEFRCNDADSTLERCRSDGGKWEPVEQCINRVLCNPNATHCDVPQCPVAGAKRCSGNQLQQCRENLTGWDTLTVCPTSNSCDPTSGCLPTLCTNDDYRCNDVTLERCVNQVWTSEAVCETSALCDAKGHVCTPPSCDPGQRECFQSVLKRCNGTRDGWDELETCRGTFVCSPITKRCEQM